MFTETDVMNIIMDLPDDRSNPVNDEYACIYNDFDGNHCIAGEVVHRLGLELPEPGSCENKEKVWAMLNMMGYDDAFSDKAIKILEEAQYVADERTHSGINNAWLFAKRRAVEVLNGVEDHEYAIF